MLPVHKNPFAVTKAVHLTTEQVEHLWVGANGTEGAVYDPTEPMPLLIVGGRGSGKTHLMRYFSFPLQSLRYEEEGIDPVAGVMRDGYIGVHVLLGSLNSQRFAGRGQPQDRWDSLFEYAMELWLARELLQLLHGLRERHSGLRQASPAIAAAIWDLVDIRPDTPFGDLDDVIAWLRTEQRQLDIDVNNVVFTGKFESRIKVTRGRLIFGIPRIVAAGFAPLCAVRFAYQLDELELLEESQQIYVQTLVREREDPTTFRIGARTYGIRTFRTLVSDEENREGAEYDRLPLDARLREKAVWRPFAFDLVRTRLAAAAGAEKLQDDGIRALFEQRPPQDDKWMFDALGQPAPGSGGHMDRLLNRLERGMAANAAPGITTSADVAEIVAALTVPGRPLLEKLNVMLLFQHWFRRRPLPEAARRISAACASYLAHDSGHGLYAGRLQLYAADMTVQLFRDFEEPYNPYAGFDNFVQMASGLPRSLLTILKDVFTWALYEGGNEVEKIGAKSQERGVREASDWFFEELRKPGDDGPAIRVAIERIAHLFEINRLADKPIEVSMMAFSVPERGLTALTAKRLAMAEHRSFLLRLDYEKDRNGRGRREKFQLNGMLAPRFGLPTARRGVARFDAELMEMLFDPTRELDFERFAVSWSAKMTAPHFGRDPVGDRKDLFGVAGL